ncbi:MAG: extracellular solute-binding protein [Anaerolineae bacterium]|nr:extracellular solute-binding protein [Anaerolineae bacterium]
MAAWCRWTSTFQPIFGRTGCQQRWAQPPQLFYDGHQWALAIDAAAQISAYRPDLLEATGQDLPRTWDEVLALAQRLKDGGKHWVAIPIVPIDSFMSLFSICAALGEDPCSTPERFVSRAVGRAALEILLALRHTAHPGSLSWNPIQTFDAMSHTDAVVYCPLLFGYSNYGRAGFAPHRLRFTNVPRTDASAVAHGPFWAAPATPSRRAASTWRWRWIMGALWPAETYSAACTPRAAANPVTAPPGWTPPPTPPAITSLPIRSRRWITATCAHATTATCTFRKPPGTPCTTG